MGKQSPAPPKFSGNVGQDANSTANYLGQSFSNGFNAPMNAVLGIPQTPDYTGAANQQAQAGQQSVNQQTGANRPGQNTPFGFSQWTQDANGNWTQNVGLGGGLGAAATGLQGQAAGLGNAMDWSQFGKLDDGSAAREQAINASYDAQAARLNPMFANREDAMKTELLNQGLDPNSQAARGARSEFNTQRQDAFSGAMNNAIREGAAAQQATFNQNLMARQQAIAEALRQRGQPLEELNALQGFTTMPGFMGAGAAPTPELLRALMAQGEYDLGVSKLRQQSWADIMKGAGEAGSVATDFLPWKK